MAIPTTGLGHLELRVTDLARAKQFYTGTLGFEHVKDGNGFVVVNVGGMMLGLVGASDEMQPGDRFVPHRVGLDHIALGVADAAALQGLQQQLDAVGVQNNGIEHDEALGGTYISFYDPDGIAWEMYAMPAA